MHPCSCCFFRPISMNRPPPLWIEVFFFWYQAGGISLRPRLFFSFFPSPLSFPIFQNLRIAPLGLLRLILTSSPPAIKVHWRDVCLCLFWLPLIDAPSSPFLSSVEIIPSPPRPFLPPFPVSVFTEDPPLSPFLVSDFLCYILTDTAVFCAVSFPCPTVINPGMFFLKSINPLNSLFISSRPGRINSLPRTQKNSPPISLPSICSDHLWLLLPVFFPFLPSFFFDAISKSPCLKFKLFPEHLAQLGLTIR